MTATSEQPTDTASWIADEHRDLLANVRGVEAILESAPSPATGDVARRIEQLATDFAEHVVDEEASPLYGDYLERYPHLRTELIELQGQHAPLVAELRDLARATSSAETVELGSELSIRIRTVIARMREHEAAEASIFHRIEAKA